MEKFDIFRDIAERTRGDIYIGVVGPMRTGKSTFIREFMEVFVLPNITGEYDRQRTRDALPQAGGGKTIMTVEPKFVPDEGVAIDLRDNLSLRVRMIDCTGYPVAGAQGYEDERGPRMVRTPWFEEPVPFQEAADVGTRKVIEDHSTIGIIVTTDGSIVDIPRANYVEPERRAVRELAEIGKPFVIVLNSKDPYSEATSELASEMEGEYGVPVIPVNCLDLNQEDILLIMEQVLYEFPVKQVTVSIPKWIQALETHHWLRSGAEDKIRQAVESVKRVRDIDRCVEDLRSWEHAAGVTIEKVDMGQGNAFIKMEATDESFLRVLSERAGMDIADKADLITMLQDYAETRKTFDKMSLALKEAEETGYGVVEPLISDMIFDEPEVIKQGRNYGVRLRARAPAIHIIKTEVETSVSPLIGSEEQGEELVNYLMEKFEDNPGKIWSTDIFGKPLHEIVKEGISAKIERMPENAKQKIQEALSKVVNEGSGGLICIII